MSAPADLSTEVSFDDIVAAAERIRPIAHRTPVLTSRTFDAAAGVQPFPHGIGAADDAITMFLQCGTQWDALAHIFDYGKMWNGQDAARVSGRLCRTIALAASAQ